MRVLDKVLSALTEITWRFCVVCRLGAEAKVSQLKAQRELCHCDILLLAHYLSPSLLLSHTSLLCPSLKNSVLLEAFYLY